MAPEHVKETVEEDAKKAAGPGEKPDPVQPYPYYAPSPWSRRGNLVQAAFWLGAVYVMGLFVVFGLLDKLMDRARAT